VILKAIQAPQMAQFDELIRQARGAAQAAGMKLADIAKAVSEIRKAG